MVFVVFLYIEIDAAVTLIGVAILQNLIHQLLLFHDVTRGMRLDAGGQTVQCCHCIVEAVGVVLGYFHRLQLLQSCLLGNLIFALISIMLQMTYIRDVTNIAHLVTDVLQVAEKYIEGNGRTGMTQMSIAVYGRTAHVHTHSAWGERTEEFLLSAQRVINE